MTEVITRHQQAAKPANPGAAPQVSPESGGSQPAAEPYRDRSTPPIRSIDPEPASGDSPYALACVWSEKTNQVFNKLQDAEELLQAEAPDSSALAIITSVLEQLRNLDEKAELLNMLAKMESSLLPAASSAPGKLNREQLQLLLEQVTGSLSTLNSTLMMAQNCDDGWQKNTLLDAGQLIAQSLGAIADNACGEDIFGGIGRWMCGPQFDEVRGNAA